MNNTVDIPMFELIYVIVNNGRAGKILRAAKEYGIRGGTVFLAKGTINNTFMNFLSLYEERKEVVLLGADRKTADHVLNRLNEKFKFEKANHGIVFSISVCGVTGSRNSKCEKNQERRGVNKAMYQCIISIVNRGNAENVIEAANAAGSKGGTIINARGSGINETSKIFNMDIEPEKEMVMILSQEEVTESIVASIREKLEIDKPGNGIIFIQDVNRIYGVYE
jgi:nitrogen regulatory protein PII